MSTDILTSKISLQRKDDPREEQENTQESSGSYPVSTKTKLKRLAQRGNYDKNVIHPILDEALVCHIAFLNKDGSPICIPNGFVRDGDSLLFHGKSNSFLQKYMGQGNPVCVEVTLFDGLVIARSAFHHSVNYRSVMIFGNPIAITDEKAKNDALRQFTEKMVPGSWHYIRKPTSSELKSTAVCRLALTEVSAKIRTGGPKDDEEDYKRDLWAGVIPTYLVAAAPIPDCTEKQIKQPTASRYKITTDIIPMPSHISRYEKVPSPHKVPGLGLSRIDPRFQVIIAIMIVVLALLTHRVLKHHSC